MHHFESNIFNSSCWPCPWPTQCASCFQCSLSPSYHLAHNFPQGKHWWVEL